MLLIKLKCMRAVGKMNGEGERERERERHTTTWSINEGESKACHQMTSGVTVTAAIRSKSIHYILIPYFCLNMMIKPLLTGFSFCGTVRKPVWQKETL